MSWNNCGVSTRIVILSVALVLAGLLAGFVLVQRHASSGPASPGPARPVPSAEQKAYFGSLEFTEPHMSAAENFLGDTVTYLDARVTNKGAKTVRQLDVELDFVDMLNQVVLRETAHPITQRAPLQPGETRAFRVSFEHMPADWNQAPPTITPVYLEF
jgi:hypothetical protein